MNKRFASVLLISALALAVLLGALSTISAQGPSATLFITDANHRLIRMPEFGAIDWAVLGGTGPGPQGQGAAAGQFTYPFSVAIDSARRIYVADNDNHRIVRIDNIGGAGWTTFGTRGSGDGQFSGLGGIAVDRTGRIFVTDTSNHRVVRIDDITGAGWATFGSQGSGPGQFNAPLGIALDSTSRIYVLDRNNHRVVRIGDMTGADWEALGREGAGTLQFAAPWAITVDQGGRLYISDMFNHRIVRVDDMTGKGWTVLGGHGPGPRGAGGGVGQFAVPWGIAVDEAGRIYVADHSNHRLVRVNDMTGAGWTIVGRPGSPGSGIGRFTFPWAVALISSDR